MRIWLVVPFMLTLGCENVRPELPRMTGDFCEGQCVGLAVNAAHCGACGVACTNGRVCTNGRCECPIGQKYTSGPLAGCYALDTDRNNCGGIGHVCPGNIPCIESACICLQDECGDAGCFDFRTDEANCGACGRACGPTEECLQGNCYACQETCCNGADCFCAHLQVDETNCGACNVRCAVGQVCASGECRCPELWQKVCAGACVDPSSDPQNCGECGFSCNGLPCVGGVCQCLSCMMAVDAGSGRVTCVDLP
ncbi:MAG: hypothetical protein JNM17_01790 [Archangium sp.]|nr:hypothetical protein [Archangium sp.]